MLTQATPVSQQRSVTPSGAAAPSAGTTAAATSPAFAASGPAATSSSTAAAATAASAVAPLPMSSVLQPVAYGAQGPLLLPHRTAAVPLSASASAPRPRTARSVSPPPAPSQQSPRVFAAPLGHVSPGTVLHGIPSVPLLAQAHVLHSGARVVPVTWGGAHTLVSPRAGPLVGVAPRHHSPSPTRCASPGPAVEPVAAAACRSARTSLRAAPSVHETLAAAQQHVVTVPSVTHVAAAPTAFGFPSTVRTVDTGSVFPLAHVTKVTSVVTSPRPMRPGATTPRSAGSRSVSPAPVARPASNDTLLQQVHALQQAKHHAAAQHAFSQQQIASRQEELRRETIQALCQSSNGLAEALKRWPSPRPEDARRVDGDSRPQPVPAVEGTQQALPRGRPCSPSEVGNHRPVSNAEAVPIAVRPLSVGPTPRETPHESGAQAGEVDGNHKAPTESPSAAVLSEPQPEQPLEATERMVPATVAPAKQVSPRQSSPPRRAGYGRGRPARSPSPARGASPAATAAGAEAQTELARLRETIQWCGNAITPKMIRELRNLSLQRPAEPVMRVFEATATLLGSPDVRMPVVRKTLGLSAGSGTSLSDKVRAIDVDAITLPQFRRVQRMLVLPEFNEEFIQGVCKNAVPLVTLCRSIGTYLARYRYQERPEAVSLLANQALASVPGPRQAPVAELEGAPSTLVSDSVLQHNLSDGGLPELAAGFAGAGGEEVANGQRREALTTGLLGNLSVTPDISRMSPRDLRAVEELTVGRPDVGSITFHGQTDCSELDIPALVHLERGEVLVYPMPGSKPPVGQGLNKRATVTMYQCWPPNGRGNLGDEKAQERYRWKIQQMTEEKRAKFIDYDCNTGIWKFQVDHF